MITCNFPLPFTVTEGSLSAVCRHVDPETIHDALPHAASKPSTRLSARPFATGGLRHHRRQRPRSLTSRQSQPLLRALTPSTAPSTIPRRQHSALTAKLPEALAAARRGTATHVKPGRRPRFRSCDPNGRSGDLLDRVPHGGRGHRVGIVGRAAVASSTDVAGAHVHRDLHCECAQGLHFWSLPRKLAVAAFGAAWLVRREGACREG